MLVGAVAAAVGFQVPNSANRAGYESELLREAVSFGNGDVRVRPRETSIFADADALASRLSRYPGVRTALPVLLLPGAIRGKGALNGAPVLGVNTTSPFHPFRLIAGELLSSGDSQGVLVGRSLAERLPVSVGDRVVLHVLLPPTPKMLHEDNARRYTLVVRGLVGGTFGAQESVFMDREFFAQDLGMPRAASMIFVYLDNHDRARSLAQLIAAEMPQVQARAWIDDSAYLSSSMQASRALGAISEAMVVAAVVIPVLALLFVHVLNRRRDIGILAALGFGPAEIFFVFLTQALWVGLLGSVLGCGIGWVLIRYFQAHPIFEWEGFVIRPLLVWGSFVRPVLVVLSATVLAGTYPALRAARLDPAPVFRGLV